jgi:hypothetical protein
MRRPPIGSERAPGPYPARTSAAPWDLLAGTDALSSEQRDQSIAFAAPSRSSSTRWSRCQTPALCQSRKRRQQVMPQPQPISRGSISQGMPDFSTNRMPVSAAPCGPRRAGGRPWVAALVAAGAAPAKPTTDRRRVPWPWPSDGHGRGPSRGSVTRFNTTLPGSDQASAAYQGLAERIVSTQIIDLAVKNLECGRVVLALPWHLLGWLSVESGTWLESREYELSLWQSSGICVSSKVALGDLEKSRLPATPAKARRGLGGPGSRFSRCPSDR